MLSASKIKHSDRSALSTVIYYYCVSLIVATRSSHAVKATPLKLFLARGFAYGELMKQKIVLEARSGFGVKDADAKFPHAALTTREPCQA
jgi:hypothetical protein